MTALSFVIPRKECISSNDRLHFQVARKRVASLRDIATQTAHLAGATRVRGVVDIIVTLSWPDRRRRDAPNMWPTVKALIDGMTDAGVLEDDSDAHVRRTVFQAGPDRSPKGTVALHIELKEAT